jgi:Family of unknown function (DUF6298)/Putative collagen-binding domain of a collagenase
MEEILVSTLAQADAWIKRPPKKATDARRHATIEIERSLYLIRPSKTFLFCILGFAVFFFASPPPATSSMGPLRIHPSNSRYFIDGSGKAIYLTGSHVHVSLINRGPTDPPRNYDFLAYLNFLQAYNHNFIRLWAHELFMEPGEYAEPFPWQRTGPAEANDGNPKFDLSRFDQSFFDRMRSRVIAARDRGIYVSIMFFKSEGNAAAAGFGHPFGADNNINDINADPNGDGWIREFYTGAVPEILEIQKAYIAKVIDTVNDLDNVLYEIANEALPESGAWQHSLIEFIHNYQRGMRRQHPVGMTAFYASDPDYSNGMVWASPAEWISPGMDTGDYSNNPPSTDGAKVILLDTDHLSNNNWGENPDGADRSWVWKSFVRGYHPILMDKMGSGSTMMSVGSRWESARSGMGQALRYANRVGLAAMTPRGDLSSTAYALANPGAEYLVYQPADGSFTVNLASGKYDIEWLNPETGAVIQGSSINGGTTRTFDPPFGGHAVLYLKNSNIAPPAQSCHLLD